MAIGIPSIHEVQSVPSMGESVLGVYLETSPSTDHSLCHGPDKHASNKTRHAVQSRKAEDETKNSSTSSKSCLRVPQWVLKWTPALPKPSAEPRKRPRPRFARPNDRLRQWRMYGGGRACMYPRQPLASAEGADHENDNDDDDDDDDVDSLQASAHFSISCVSNGRNSNTAMDRLCGWGSRDDDDDEEDDDAVVFYEARNDEASPILTGPMRSSSSSSATASSAYVSSQQGRRPLMTLDSYLSRHNNPPVAKSKASKVTKTTKTTAASSASAGGGGGGGGVRSTIAAKVVDIAHVDTGDNQSVHSEMCMAVSFDHDYAQLVLTATAQGNDDDDGDDDELSSFAGDDLLGIAHSHPAAVATSGGARCPSPPPSFVRGENTAPPPSRYSMRQNHPAPRAGAIPKAAPLRPRNPWRDMVVEDSDEDTGSFRGVEEWSVAAASVLIETTFTDWGASHDDDDEDDTDVDSNAKRGRAAGSVVQGIVKVRNTPLGSGSLPPVAPKRMQANMQHENDSGCPYEHGADDDGEDEKSFRSDESECPFDERAFKAPHLRSAQPGRRSQFAAAPRSGSKRAVPLVEV
jgi:hypothetical protein